MKPLVQNGLQPAPAEPVPAARITSPPKGPVFGFPGEVTESGQVAPASLPLWQRSETAIDPPLASTTAGGAISELAGSLPPAPPMVGQRSDSTPMSGIPDWGILKLAEQSYHDRGLAAGAGDYPAFHVPPGPAIDPPTFVPPGADPATDPAWNFATNLVAGMGPGQARAGAVASGGISGVAARSLRLLPRPVDVVTGDPLPALPVVVSGVVYPADRGVLAIVRWPPNHADGSLATAQEFVAQPLLQRCVAAVLLGQGISPSPLPGNSGDPGRCASPGSCGGSACDGASGGIFDPGRDLEGQYDPTAFPGRASGQYDLDEVLRGTDGLDGLPLRKPFDDFNGDGVPGAQKIRNAPVPAAGQVRLGTDPAAGPVEPYGIPVLGASSSAYDPTPADVVAGHIVVGSTVVRAGTVEPNFLAYRLPYLQDYEVLAYTPRGVDRHRSREQFRFFRAIKPAAPHVPDPLPSAGLYGGYFRHDSWSRQLARFRHMFLLPSQSPDPLAAERLGTYWLLHFKKEADFESMVASGVLPWDPKASYGLYGAAPLPSGMTHPGCVANLETSPQPSPRGPAPAYGHASPSYHAVRHEVALVPSPAAPDFAATATWGVPSPAPAVWVSGVAYYLATDPATGDSAFSLGGFLATSKAPDTVFAGGFGVDDAALANHAAAPARIASPDPAVLLVGDLAFGEHPARPGQPSLDVPVGGAPPSTLTSFAGSADQPRLRRVDIPLSHCGSNGAGPYGDANAPAPSDPLAVLLTQDCPLRGDLDEPSFCADAELRFAVRPRHVPGTLPAHGFPVAWNPAARILLHTTRCGPADPPRFGNFLDGGVPARPLPSLLSADRDRQERFLDEVYRWSPDFAGADAAAGSGAAAALQGPGLQGWRGGPIEVPARVASRDAWASASWLRRRLHEKPLGAQDLQVSGMPRRSPPLSDGARFHRPPCGVLRYPSEDYGGARPSQAQDGLAAPQPSYAKSSGTRSYIRVLDLGSAAAGSPVFSIRVEGFFLADLAFRGPGPGRLGSGGAALLVKIPGLTAWLDAGRRDGDGPGKHHPRQDGAGCLVIGPETRDEVDPDSRLPACVLRLHVGTAARAFQAASGEVPLLVKVLMGPDAAGADLAHPLVAGAYGPADPEASSASVRGLVRVQVA